MDVTLNTEELLKKRTIFEQEIKKEIGRAFLIRSMILFAIYTVLCILDFLEYFTMSVDYGLITYFAILTLGVLMCFSKAVKIVRFYEAALGLTDQKTKI